MIKRNQNGSAGSVMLFFLTFILLIAALGFGAWAYSGRQTYKKNATQLINTAVASAKKQQQATDTAAFQQQENDPLQTYTGPEAYGSIIINYPKVWSGYIDDTGSGNALVDAYFSPGVVPALGATTSIYALRVQVISQAYSGEVSQITQGVQGGSMTAIPYALPRVPSVVGLKVNGQMPDGSLGTEVILPVRNQTILIWTDGSQFISQFNNYILPNFSFSP